MALSCRVRAVWLMQMHIHAARGAAARVMQRKIDAIEDELSKTYTPKQVISFLRHSIAR